MHDPDRRNEFVKNYLEWLTFSNQNDIPNGILINLSWMIFQFSFQQIKNLFDFFVMIWTFNFLQTRKRNES